MASALASGARGRGFESRLPDHQKSYMPRKRVLIVYSGAVQGVGFRWTAERAANSLGLAGWVKNCPDGTVETVCEGEESDLGAFINKIKKSMEHYIRSADTSWGEATGEFDSFNIRFYS